MKEGYKMEKIELKEFLDSNKSSIRNESAGLFRISSGKERFDYLYMIRYLKKGSDILPFENDSNFYALVDILEERIYLDDAYYIQIDDSIELSGTKIDQLNHLSEEMTNFLYQESLEFIEQHKYKFDDAFKKSDRQEIYKDSIKKQVKAAVVEDNDYRSKIIVKEDNFNQEEILLYIENKIQFRDRYIREYLLGEKEMEMIGRRLAERAYYEKLYEKMKNQTHLLFRKKFLEAVKGNYKTLNIVYEENSKRQKFKIYNCFSGNRDGVWYWHITNPKDRKIFEETFGREVLIDNIKAVTFSRKILFEK